MQLCPLPLCFSVFLCLAASLSGAAPTKNYAVKPGDTLFSLAKRNGISVEKLKAINGINSNHLQAGRSLQVKGNSPSAPVPVTRAAKKSVPVRRPSPAPVKKPVLPVVKKSVPVSSAARAQSSYRTRSQGQRQAPTSEGDTNHREISSSRTVRKGSRRLPSTFVIAEEYDRDTVVRAELFLRAEGAELPVQGQATGPVIHACRDYLNQNGRAPEGEAALIEVIARAQQQVPAPYKRVRVDPEMLANFHFARQNLDSKLRLSELLARQANMSESLLIMLNPGVNFDTLRHNAYYVGLNPAANRDQPAGVSEKP